MNALQWTVLMKDLEFFEKWGNEVWFSIFSFCRGNELVLNVIVPLIIMLTVYWTVSAFFILVDITGKPYFVIKFKIPDSTAAKYPRFTTAKFQMVASQVLFNQTVISILVIYICYMLRNYLGYDREMRLPKPHIFALDIALLRLLHHPYLYKHFHKKHHEWVSPVGLSAIYCHPVEHVLSNVLPTFMGSIIAGTHITSLWAWFTFTTAYGVIVHSGYHLPLTPTPGFHHYHHLKFNENFSVAGILDWLHGTDKHFRNFEAHKRDVVLFSLTPLSVQDNHK
ncbi:unnamed protein product [Larinioides sclopetarius]|uniref:Fatty acid hydroxylase domain-containing protein n=1 Tax=Larinioides sclopetarius TaxID=280406 RepID=A0AAV1Z4K9_9ARAC